MRRSLCIVSLLKLHHGRLFTAGFLAIPEVGNGDRQVDRENEGSRSIDAAKVTKTQQDNNGLVRGETGYEKSDQWSTRGETLQTS